MDEAGNIERIRDLIRKNDPAALDMIYDLFGDRLYRYLLVILGAEVMAEDVLQNLFVRLAENRWRLAQAENLGGYLFAMARNLALNARRGRAKPGENIEDYAAILALPADDPGAAEERAQVLKAVRELPLDQQEVVTMKCWQDMTFEEIAGSLQISLNTAASRYRYALKKLRKNLETLRYERA
jgi:RNA polymerase sigma-70 factor (ECF subfamily)